MARIDRLNYRDIGVIKAPLCWDPFYEGVEVTRDSTPGVRILAFSPSLFSIPSYDSRQGPSVTSSPRVCSRAFLDNALLISHYPAGDAPSVDRRGARSIAWCF